MKSGKKKIKWMDSPEDQDYSGAFSYLELISGPASAKRVVSQYSEANITEVKAKDVIRAAQLPLLGKKNFHVAKDLRKIEKKVPLSPILLVRGDASKRIPLVIADGYHRACAVYFHDEDAFIKVKLVDWKEN